LGLAAAEEYKRSAGEDFKSDYSEIVTVMIVIPPDDITNKSSINSRIH
jgi:hypothetical protein